jgi:hypothetical protein
MVVWRDEQGDEQTILKGTLGSERAGVGRREHGMDTRRMAV